MRPGAFSGSGKTIVPKPTHGRLAPLRVKSGIFFDIIISLNLI
jgi:hypothetical protein